MGNKDHIVGDNSPTQATSQCHGPELIFYVTSEGITSPHNTSQGHGVEIIINSSKFNSESPRDKYFPYNMKHSLKTS